MHIPALGVDTAIIPVGVDDNGQLDIPEDVQTVGWYRFGPAPGATQGSAVLTGHVDDYRQGAGALADLVQHRVSPAGVHQAALRGRPS